MPYGYGAPYGGYGHWGGPPGPRPPPGFGPRPPYWGPGGVSSPIFDLYFHGKMILNEIIKSIKNSVKIKCLLIIKHFFRQTT